MILSDLNIELLGAQSHENMAIIPLKTPVNYSLDLLSLKKGFELGLVEVKECETSTVNTLIVENKSVSPLVLIDGEEIVGGDQNRIVSATTIIAPQSSSKISVNCSEKGRWGFKSNFKQSEYIANYNTRRQKAYASRSHINVQASVWDSIDCLEENIAHASPTQAMSESYDSRKIDHEKFISAFHAVDGQTGVLIIIDGEIKGFELFLNSEIYREYHEKIIRSYLIDSEIKNTQFAINMDEASLVIENARNSSYDKKETEGLEDCFEFENEAGLGLLYTYENEVIHWSYFKKEENMGNEKSYNHIGVRI